ncbi:hypothetical protein [Fibrella forsythiae]|uniref:Outer membrane protein beta-barrel domain-containing protein n=1 Tax=Fibrella forsythiae TaxID=2817061 RepID=A0ABS3JH86_9BACT|nr:hypothetical protein [Fibrella forsythiae]MBO0949373.1 hypothetical protein [Fibrella forsythiae]
MKSFLLFCTLFCFLLATPVLCQRRVPDKLGYFGEEKIIVKLDPFSNIPEKSFPFDRWFYIRRYYKNGSLPLKAVFITPQLLFPRTFDPTPSSPTSVDFFDTKSDITDGYPTYTQAYDILVPPLKPNSTYDLVFAYPMNDDQRERLTEAFIDLHAVNNYTKRNPGPITDQAIIARKKTITDIINRINREKTANQDYLQIDLSDFELYYTQIAEPILASGVSASTRATLLASLANGGNPVTLAGGETAQVFQNMELLSVSGTASFKLETRVGIRVQPDFGAIFYGLGGTGSVGVNSQFLGVVPYVGVNFLFRPFDADIPISFLKRDISALDRLSIHAGVTLFSLAKDNYRQNLFNANNLMIGVGYRLSSVAKLTGGVVLYRKRTDTSPLYTETRLAPIGYVGISVDLRVREVLKDIGKFLFGA